MHDTLALIIEYRYWILIPLSFVEGPIVAFFAGTLASLGYFNIYVLAVFFLVRDITVDLLCYWVGYWGIQTRLAQWLLKKMRVTAEHLEDIRQLWHKNPGKTMFFSKLSYGVAAAFIVVAGSVEVPLSIFVRYALLVALMHYGLLLVLGYFFGNAFGGTIAGILEKIPYVLAGLGVLAIVYYFVKRYITRRLEEAERNASK